MDDMTDSRGKTEGTEEREEAVELRRARMIAAQMIVVGLVLLFFGLLSFFLSGDAAGTYQGKWRYVSTLGLALVGILFLCLGAARKKRLPGR